MPCISSIWTKYNSSTKQRSNLWWKWTWYFPCADNINLFTLLLSFVQKASMNAMSSISNTSHKVFQLLVFPNTSCSLCGRVIHASTMIVSWMRGEMNLSRIKAQDVIDIYNHNSNDDQDFNKVSIQCWWEEDFEANVYLDQVMEITLYPCFNQH